MNNNEFNKLFNANIPSGKFDVRTGKTLGENINNFQKLTFLKHNCKFLHNYLSNIYGDEYGDKIVTDLLQDRMEISNPEQFTFNTFPYVEESMCLNKFQDNAYNTGSLLTVIAELENIMINETRYGRHILFPDVLIILSVFYTKFISKKSINNAFFLDKKEQYKFVQTMLKNFFRVLSSKYGEDNLITLGVIDKQTFQRLTRENKYVFSYMDYVTFDRLVPHYKDYLRFIKVFLKCYKQMSKTKKYQLPKITYFIHPTETLNRKVLLCLEEFLGVHYIRFAIAFRNTFITEYTDVDTEEFTSVLEDCITKAKSNKTVEEVREFIRELITEGLNPFGDRKDYTELPIYKCMKKFKIKFDTPYILYNTYSTEKVFEPKRSEVIINYEKIYNELNTVDEQLEILSKYYIDAQAINQARLSIFKGVNYSDCRCHVKIKGIKQELVPSVFIKLQEQTLFLRSAYNVNFTFEIINSI